MTKIESDDFINRIRIYGEELIKKQPVQKIKIGKKIVFLNKNDSICDAFLKN